MVFRGFLTTKVQLGGVNFVLKSLNPRELESIRDRTPLKTDKTYNEVFEALILAYGMYLLEGENVLLGRPQNLGELVTEMRGVPQNLRNDLMGEILILQKAQDYSLLKLEGFCYEQSSRSIWQSYKGRIPNDPMLTGIGGTDRLGLNSHQIAWAFINEEEDRRVEAETMWGFAKFVASASNPKGVRKIESSDAARLKKMMEDRDRIRLGNKPVDDSVKGPRSVEDLRSQLEGDVTGKQDLHDKIVSQYEYSLRKRRESRAAEYNAKMLDAQEKARTVRDEMTDEELANSLTDGTGFVKVFNKEQIEQMRERQGQQALKRVRDIHQSRIQHTQQYKKDREDIARDLQKLADQETPSRPPSSLDIPTGETGPTGPVRISTQPVRSTRLPHPPTHTATGTGPDTGAVSRPALPHSDGSPVSYKTLPNGDRIPVYANPSKGSDRSGEGGISLGGASSLLTRHTYGPPQQREQGRRVQTKQVSVKKTGTVYTEVPGEDDFFAGGEITFTDTKAKK